MGEVWNVGNIGPLKFSKVLIWSLGFYKLQNKRTLIVIYTPTTTQPDPLLWPITTIQPNPKKKVNTPFYFKPWSNPRLTHPLHPHLPATTQQTPSSFHLCHITATLNIPPPWYSLQILHSKNTPGINNIKEKIQKRVWRQKRKVRLGSNFIIHGSR